MKTGTDRLAVLVALEPLSYRDAIGEVIQTLRPDLEVEIVAPDDLRREVERLEPGLVLCSHHMPATFEDKRVWVELYPYTEPEALRVGGKRRDLGKAVELDDLLAVVDDLVRRTPQAG